MKTSVSLRIVTILLCVFMQLLVSSCMTYDIEQILLERDDISMTIKGDLCFAFEPLTCQMGYNADKNEFRVYDDALGNLFVITCDRTPDTEGMKLIATMTYTTSSSTNSLSGLEFSVEKLAADGTVWMWNASKKIGVVVSKLK